MRAMRDANEAYLSSDHPSLPRKPRHGIPGREVGRVYLLGRCIGEQRFRPTNISGFTRNRLGTHQVARLWKRPMFLCNGLIRSKRIASLFLTLRPESRDLPSGPSG